MKTLKTTVIALVIAFGSSAMLTGCFVDDEEIFEEVNTQDNTNSGESNEEEWGS